MATKKVTSGGFSGDDLDLDTPIETVSGDAVASGRAFLARFGVDVRKLSNEQVIEKLDKIREAKAKSVQVLSKGPTIDGMERILERIPSGYVGEFKRDTDVDIKRAETLGWAVFFDEGNKKEVTPTGTADGRIRYGDQVLMFMPEEQYIANKLVKLERIERRKVANSQEKVAQRETSAWEIPVVKL